jgi:GxxExxY protein
MDGDLIIHHGGQEFEEISHKVIGCAIEVHRLLGPGLLESSYQRCLSRELELQRIEHQCEVPIPIAYKDVTLDCGYRIDLLVEQKLILELKSVRQIEPIHEAQILTYLKLSGIRMGLLLNFNVTLLTKGLKRFVL